MHWRIALPDILEIVREAALDKKAEDFTEIDVEGRTIIADTFVVITGRSKIQTRSIADSIVGENIGGRPARFARGGLRRRKLDPAGFRPRRRARLHARAARLL